jgi:hypothetical protein
MSGSTGDDGEEPHPKRVRKIVNAYALSYSGLGAMLFNLPAELCNYILKLAISPTPGVVSMRKALDEYQTSWKTMASLRLMRKRANRPDDGLNALFYEATMRLWMQKERIAYADACITKGELRRVQERDRDMFCALQKACGRDNAAWKRALTAYKGCKDLPDAQNVPLLTP